MLIEVRKAGFVNKGAELMLRAVLHRVGRQYPDASFLMAPGSRQSTPYHRRCELGLYQKAWAWVGGLQFGDLAGLAPRRLREAYGVVLDREVDVVLDAAGFAYSDQWGVDPTLELARATARWKRRGTRVVLLPQAFGPFNSRVSSKAIARAIDRCDLVFPRDRFSEGHLRRVVGSRSNIYRAPDFTNLIEGVKPESSSMAWGGFCVVPNMRMIDKVNGDAGRGYIPFMVKCVQTIKSMGGKPFLLIHEGRSDQLLAQEIASASGEIPIVQEQDTLRIKGLIGASAGFLGSRYHGLVSALSQGVPALGTGWSHKYAALFEDYGFTEGLIGLDMPDANLRKALDSVINPDSSRRIARAIEAKAVEQRLASEGMWQRVFEIIDSAREAC